MFLIVILGVFAEDLAHLGDKQHFVFSLLKLHQKQDVLIRKRLRYISEQQSLVIVRTNQSALPPSENTRPL